MALAPTPSQTVGPFFHIGTDDGFIGRELVSPDRPGAVRLFGVVRDGDGVPVIDAMIEVWQANAAGRYAHPEDVREEVPLEEGFDGSGRTCTDDDGRYEFVTVKPGSVPGLGGSTQAPHIDVSVFARGLLRRLVTRIYFPDEAEANEADPLLASIEDPAARASLVAVEDDGGLRFDISLQGDRETTFFAV
ncbi:MAG: protocatechuate 3,4-dioxygenase, alpha subunit [Thermoleophilaceae bacterium]|nr:protocatechuate 3,4-dioxygenase, alpha subunit [Thermoleophilaceae bacterium]